MKRVILIAVIAACTKPAGGPLKYTFDDTKIAAVPLDKKQAVTQAQQAHDLARLAHQKADEDYSDSKVEVEIARYQADHSVLVSELVAARTGSATTNAETAALARRAAAAKVDFTSARRTWLEQLASSTFYDVYAAQAKLELERARAAQANNMAPAGFDISAFEKQVDERARAAQDASAAAQKERAAAELKLGAWADAEHAFLTACGFKGPAESDRAQEDWKQAAAPAAAPAPAPAAAPTADTAPAPAPPPPAN